MAVENCDAPERSHSRSEEVAQTILLEPLKVKTFSHLKTNILCFVIPRFRALGGSFYQSFRLQHLDLQLCASRMCRQDETINVTLKVASDSLSAGFPPVMPGHTC